LAEVARPQRISFLLQLVALNQRMEALVTRELARDGVTVRDYALLSTIGAFGPLTLTDAAETLGMPLTTVSDAGRRLVDRGAAERLPNREDGRSHLLVLTEAGDAEWRRGWPALRRTNAAIERHLALSEGEARDAIAAIDRALALALQEGKQTTTDSER
jgi:DNA-binding MarR family transcriptional regulator